MFNIIYVILGTIIGAGFASGSEIYIFFGKFGINGFIGIILTSLFFFIVIYKLISKNQKYNASNLCEYIYYKYNMNNIIFSKSKYLYNAIISIFIRLTMYTFTLISFYIMISGFSSLLLQAFYIPKIVGNVLLSLICFFIFNKSTNMIVFINKFLCPILIILIIFLGIKTIDIKTFELTFEFNNNFIICSILYASYNTIILAPILISLCHKIKTKKQCFFVSLISSIIIFILASLIYGMLLSNFNSKKIELPILYISSNLSSLCKYIYSFVILSSILTSCISSGFSFLDNYNKKIFRILNCILCISGIFIGNISFSNLINLFYPIYGYLGLIYITLLIF